MNSLKNNTDNLWENSSMIWELNSDMTSWTPEQWEDYLNKTEWNIDNELWLTIWSSVSEISSIMNLNELLDYINSIEDKNDIRINIDDDEQSIIIYDVTTWNIVWEIKPWNYSYNWLEKSQHMFHVVNEPYKWLWYWKLLLEAYWKLESFNYKNFKLPKEEYTHTSSMLSLLTKFWYYIEWKYESWELIELSDYEVSDLYEIVASRWFEDDNLWHTYKLKLNK